MYQSLMWNERMTRLDAGRPKRSAVDPGSKKIQIESRRSAAAQPHDIGDRESRREQGQEELGEKRHPVVVVQQNGQQEYG